MQADDEIYANLGVECPVCEHEFVVRDVVIDTSGKPHSRGIECPKCCKQISLGTQLEVWVAR